MSSTEKPLAPALNMVAPAITSNNLDFYVFYNMSFGSTNYIGITSMQSQSWGTANLTGPNSYISNASPIGAATAPSAISVNGTVYVSYVNTSNQIVVISGSGTTWKQLPILPAYKAIVYLPMEPLALSDTTITEWWNIQLIKVELGPLR